MSIFDLITLAYNKTLVFDWDGTMTEFKYTEDKLLPCKDEDLDEYAKEHHTIYKNMRALKTMQYIVDELNIRDIYIVTVTVPYLIDGKNEAIKSHFPDLLDKNIYHVSKSSDKIKALEQIYKESGKHIIFVDDTAKTLLDAEETLDFVTGVHISSLIA